MKQRSVDIPTVQAELESITYKTRSHLMQITCAEVNLFKPCSERILTFNSHSRYMLKLFVLGNSTVIQVPVSLT